MAETELATLGGGCFWCVEAPMKELRGVHEVTSGYAGGHVEDPTYEQVCSGTTGHAEVVQVAFDPDVISYRELLEVFFAVHDPTTEDRQGPDVGSQYRSAVYYHTEEQRETVESLVEALESNGTYDGIVTEVEPLETFTRPRSTTRTTTRRTRTSPTARRGYPRSWRRSGRSSRGRSTASSSPVVSRRAGGRS